MSVEIRVVVAQVADVDVAQAIAERDAARPPQRRKRRGRVSEHAKIGMEGREVQRDLGAEVGDQPAGHRVQLGSGGNTQADAPMGTDATSKIDSASGVDGSSSINRPTTPR